MQLFKLSKRTRSGFSGIVVAGLLLMGAELCVANPSPFAQRWINGTDTNEPQYQVQHYDSDTYVIRQSLRTNPEGNFMYLLFGSERALLLDSGAAGLKIRPAVDVAVAEWLKDHNRTDIPLIVAHSHGHDDHHAGDAELRLRPNTTVVGIKPAEVAAFFKVTSWPNSVSEFDLGGRVLHVIPTPGHQPAHIMIFDAGTRLLLSGDTLYPGRLYIPANNYLDYRDSINRVVAFTKDRDVTHILGAHIEMTVEAARDYPLEAASHPHERALELPYWDLLELQFTLQKMGDVATRDDHSDFIVFPLPPRMPRPDDAVPKP
jgi:glyoxylase-like metal-dependent hydrolase (beta-lactamase superfamily II)